MSDDSLQNGVSENGNVPEIELIIKVSTKPPSLAIYMTNSFIYSQYLLVPSGRKAPYNRNLCLSLPPIFNRFSEPKGENAPTSYIDDINLRINFVFSSSSVVVPGKTSTSKHHRWSKPSISWMQNSNRAIATKLTAA